MTTSVQAVIVNIPNNYETQADGTLTSSQDNRVTSCFVGFALCTALAIMGTGFLLLRFGKDEREKKVGLWMVLGPMVGVMSAATINVLKDFIFQSPMERILRTRMMIHGVES